MPARRITQHSSSAPARLVKVAEDGHSLPGSGIALDGPELTIGSSPRKAACVLESTSVDGLHARLRQASGGQFRIYDAGSVAGTWVNYAPVGREGVTLQHGDLVQIGRETLRFELKTLGTRRKAVVIDENHPSEDAGETAAQAAPQALPPEVKS
jgi:pSer/pThr/pTyr-binding forkhead associated (FHA) protein